MDTRTWNRFRNSSLFYIILGVALALGINQGLALALSTDMPVVAVESNSMVPTFYEGDMLVLMGAGTGSLGIGDIIVFDQPNGGTPIVHRIVAINSDGTFQTKGDANNGQHVYERSIQEEQIHGRVVMIIPLMGWIKISVTRYVLPNMLWVFIVAALIGMAYIGRRTLFTGISRRIGGVA